MRAVVYIPDNGTLKGFMEVAKNPLSELGFFIIKRGEDLQEAVIRLSVILRKPLEGLLKYLLEFFSSVSPECRAAVGVAVLYNKPAP